MAVRPVASADHSKAEQELRVLSDTEFSILEALALYIILTAEQVCRLFFSFPGSLRYAQEVLRRLCDDDGLLLRSYVPKPSPGGRAKYIFRLSNAGRRVLMQSGVDVRPRFRPTETISSRGALDHLIGCTDFSISATKLCQLEPSLSVEVSPEWTLKGKPVRVRDAASGKEVAVIGDSYLVFGNQRGQQLHVLYEHDMGTERRAKLTTKLRHLLALVQGPYKLLGAPAITVALLAPTPPARAQQIVTWLEGILVSEKAEGLAESFWIAGTSVTATTPHDLFLSRLWQVPLHDGKHALLGVLL